MSIITVEAEAAAAEFARLLESVEQGDEVVVERDGRPVARLVPEPRRRLREPGFWKGRVWMSDDFDDPLPAEMMASIEGPIWPDDADSD